MVKTASDTFSWISVEAEAEGRVVRVTVDFADILEATRRGRRDADGDSAGHTAREPLGDRDVDACDGVLAEERLEDAEWVNWSDARRELQRQD